MLMKWMILAMMMAFGIDLRGDTCNHSHKQIDNNLVPIGRVVLNPVQTNDQFAVSLIGEAGHRNFRANGTFGGWTTENSRLKVSGEYLVQRLSWKFSSGKSTEWVQQGAVGADWQYLIDCGALQALDLSGYYSYSPGKHLKTHECFDGGTVQRRLAGAQGYGGSLSSVLFLYECARLDLSLDYDHVTYRRKFKSDKVVSGLGGGFALTSRLPWNVDLVLEAEFRRPFNYYGAKIVSPTLFNLSGSSLGLFGGYTKGKNKLPNSFVAGIELVYAFGSCSTIDNVCSPVWDPCSLNAWVITPAVYMPEVLAIVDELKVPCQGPTSSPIPAQTISHLPNPNYSLNIATLGNFKSPEGGPLTYIAQNLPGGATIDHTTGLLTGANDNNTANPVSYLVTVIASDQCSSTSQTFTLTFLAAGH